MNPPDLIFCKQNAIIVGFPLPHFPSQRGSSGPIWSRIVWTSGVWPREGSHYTWPQREIKQLCLTKMPRIVRRNLNSVFLFITQFLTESTPFGFIGPKSLRWICTSAAFYKTQQNNYVHLQSAVAEKTEETTEGCPTSAATARLEKDPILGFLQLVEGNV